MNHRIPEATTRPGRFRRPPAETSTLIRGHAAQAGGFTVEVDAGDPFDARPACGHVFHGDRPGRGLLLHCQSCGTSLHTGLAGTRRVTPHTLRVRSDRTQPGL